MLPHSIMARISFAPIAALVGLAAVSAHAQNGAPLYAGSQQEPVRVSVSAIALTYDGGPSQLAVPLAVYAPVARGFGLSLHTTYASGDLESNDGISGFGDAQIAGSYFLEFGPGSAVASLGANVPIGQRELTASEAETAYLMGQSFYEFTLPVWGQGFNLSPGLTFAVPVNDALALGAGIAYQHRGTYSPLAGAGGEFDPGSEFLATAGADVRLAPETTLALDLTYSKYGTDTYGNLEYEVADAVALTGQVTHALGRGELRVLGRAQVRGAGTSAPVATALDSAVPLSLRLRSEARLPFSESFALTLLAQGRHYGASDVFESYTLFDAALRPEVAMGPLAFHVQAGGTVGTLTGLRVGGGLSWEF